MHHVSQDHLFSLVALLHTELAGALVECSMVSDKSAYTINSTFQK